MKGLVAVALAAAALAGAGDARTQADRPLLTYFLGSPFRAPGGGGLCATTGPGAPAIRLTDPVNAQRPTWSPDGSRVAFFRTPRQELEGWSVLVADADGSHEHALAPRYAGEQAFPAWSADGSRIAFVLRDATGSNLVTVKPDGTDFRRVVGSPTRNGYMSFPAWSPDGTQLAFSLTDLPNVSGLFVIPSSGGSPRLLAPDSAGAAWSPAGDEIAFTHAGQEIVVEHLDGGDARVVAAARDGRDAVGFPAWSPDGRTIAFTRQEADLARVMTVGVDGTGERAVAGTRELGAFFPAWRPGPAPRLRVARPCVVRGSGHADRLVGTSAGDVLLGESGNDVILGRGGPDLVLPGLGRDVVRGGAGNDWIYAVDGAPDLVDGGPGLDRSDADLRDRFRSVERREPPW